MEGVLLYCTACGYTMALLRTCGALNTAGTAPDGLPHQVAACLGQTAAKPSTLEGLHFLYVDGICMYYMHVAFTAPTSLPVCLCAIVVIHACAKPFAEGIRCMVTMIRSSCQHLTTGTDATFLRTLTLQE